MLKSISRQMRTSPKVFSVKSKKLYGYVLSSKELLGNYSRFSTNITISSRRPTKNMEPIAIRKSPNVSLSLDFPVFSCR